MLHHYPKALIVTFLFLIWTLAVHAQEKSCPEISFQDKDGKTVVGVSDCYERGAKFLRGTVSALEYEAAILANDVYYDDESDVASSELLATGWKFLKTKRDGDDKKVNFYKNEKQKRIALSFMGTNTISDMVTTNIIKGIFSGDFNGFEVHSGFLSKYLFFQPSIHEFVKEFERNHKDFKYLITGHSQGAAVANLCAFDFINNLNIEGSRVDLITFAAPRTGSRKYSSLMNRIVPKNIRFVTGSSCAKSSYDQANTKECVLADDVTTVPPSFYGYKHNGVPKYLHVSNCNSFACHSMESYINSLQSHRYIEEDRWLVRKWIVFTVGLVFVIGCALFFKYFDVIKARCSCLCCCCCKPKGTGKVLFKGKEHQLP